MKLRTISLALAATLAISACGDASTDADVSGPDGPGDGVTTTLFEGGERGWLEGDDLDWFGVAGGAETGGLDMAADASGFETDDDGEVARSTTTTSGDSFSDIGPLEPPIDNTPLRAGSIDDGDDVGAYLEYRSGVVDSGVEVRPVDVSNSTVFTVTGSNGLPVLDAALEFWAPDADRAADAPVVTLRTTADGSVRFVPGAMAEGWTSLDATVRIGDVAVDVEFEWGAPAVAVSVDSPGGVDGSVPLDIHFVLDATGSMGDEIARLRDNMTSIANQIAALPSEPDVRFGMTVYRDEGDLFVTRNFDLTSDLDSFLDALAEVQAEGGGDYPEALDEALADALELPEWRRDGAVEIMIVIADAPPQIGRAVQQPTGVTALAAAQRGVKIFPVAASGTDDQAEYVMRELAFLTGGRFVFLSYGVDGAATATGPSTDITSDDYDELPLDALVVRLVQDELSALTGLDVQPVPTTTVPVTTTTFEQ